MTNTGTVTRATPLPTARMFARACAAAILALAAPAISFLPALTTNVHRSGAYVTFPHGYALMLIVTVAVTAVACALGALLAKRTALLAIPLGLALWVLIGLAATAAGVVLRHHAHLIEWGITVLAAVVAGTAAGLPLAVRQGRPSTPPPADHA